MIHHFHHAISNQEASMVSEIIIKDFICHFVSLTIRESFSASCVRDWGMVEQMNRSNILKRRQCNWTRNLPQRDKHQVGLYDTAGAVDSHESMCKRTICCFLV